MTKHQPLRQCQHCRQYKPESAFHPPLRTQYSRPRCKQCDTALAQAAWERKHHEYVTRHHKHTWRHKHDTKRQAAAAVARKWGTWQTHLAVSPIAQILTTPPPPAPWTKTEDYLLMFNDGMPLADKARLIGRTYAAAKKRKNHLLKDNNRAQTPGHF